MPPKRKFKSLDGEDSKGATPYLQKPNANISYPQTKQKPSIKNSINDEIHLTEDEKISLVLSKPKNGYDAIPSNEIIEKVKHELDDADLEETLFGSSEKTTDNAVHIEDDISEIFEADDEKEDENEIIGLKMNSNIQKSTNDESTSGSVDDLFSPDEAVSEINSNEDNTNKNLIKDEEQKHSKEKDKALNMAKRRLSKWASRLFDPDRPRGLVEAPQIIPLNDEFLKDFGKREKDFFDRVGKPLEIDRDKIVDEDLTNEFDKGNDLLTSVNSKEPNIGAKVKITNLAYITTLANLTKKVQEFGATMDINLIMDENGKMRNNIPLSIGKSYVTFSSLESATACCEEMNEKPFEGRVLRVVHATDNKSKRRSTGGNEMIRSSLSRYWEKDIATRCFRCGEVGHIREQCPNVEQLKPCPFCSLTGHEVWKCPIGNHCFNCGIPGHVSRECPFGRSLPNRVVCGICFTSGHHRWQCQINPVHIVAENAICFTCGKRGHVACKDMKWSFGLNDVFCFNCGLKGHHGSDCRRPNFDRCNRNQELASAEVERAKHWTEANMIATRELANTFEGQGNNQNYQRGRANTANNSSFRPRAKSQPAHARGYQNHNNTSGRGYNKNHNSNNQSPAQSRRGYQRNHQYNQHHQGGNRGYR